MMIHYRNHRHFVHGQKVQEQIIVDPIGRLPEFLTRVKCPFAVLAHELEKPYIEGDKPLIKLDPTRGTSPREKVDGIDPHAADSGTSKECQSTYLNLLGYE